VAATAQKAHIGTGRRKTSVARVRLKDGSGKISINGRDLDSYFTEPKDRNAVTGPLGLCDVKNKIDVVIHVHGGGITGQAGAISQGIARALKAMYGITGPSDESNNEMVNSMAKQLRDSGYLTRDGRMKERKKYGRKGARKSFQFSKR
jgi:small subunit ribosomal protein S9